MHSGANRNVRKIGKFLTANIPVNYISVCCTSLVKGTLLINERIWANFASTLSRLER